jgi:hypothetical protein
LIANALELEFFQSSEFAFAKRVMGNETLLQQVSESIRYAILVNISYVDDHSRECNCVAESAMSILESLTLFLAYPQISCRLTKQISFVESMEKECRDFPEFKEIIDRFLTRFAEVVLDLRNPNVKCKNPDCESGNEAHKSCSMCGVKYCSEDCQLQHWKNPDNSHKEFCSKDSLYRTVGKIYRDRQLSDEPGVLFFLDFTSVPVVIERRTEFVERDLKLCSCVECLNRTSAGCEERIENELEYSMDRMERGLIANVLFVNAGREMRVYEF